MGAEVTEAAPDAPPPRRMNMIQAINSAMEVVMARDPDVIVMGEDVGYFGGVFRATAGLQAKFGKTRVFDTPITEIGIMGVAIGMGAYGLRPVPEIQFADYIYPALDQLVSEAARLRYRSAGEFTSPITIRSPYGGGIFGGQTHSQSPEGIFTHVSGIKTVIPSTPYDAKGLLIAAIEDNDPVLFLEPKRIYNGPFNGHWDRPAENWSKHPAGEVPTGYYTVPLGKAEVVRAGEAITILCYGTMVHVVADVVREAGVDAGDRRPAHPRAARHRHGRGIGQEDRPMHDRPRSDTHVRLRRGAVRPGAGTLLLPSRSADRARDRLRHALPAQPGMGLFPRPGADRSGAQEDHEGLTCGPFHLQAAGHWRGHRRSRDRRLARRGRRSGRRGPEPRRHDDGQGDGRDGVPGCGTCRGAGGRGRRPGRDRRGAGGDRD
jgi:2-oxoisovalerate dehydrogenase E1 component beta subunit